MRKVLVVSLLLLTFVLAACGGQAQEVAPTAAAAVGEAVESAAETVEEVVEEAAEEVVEEPAAVAEEPMEEPTSAPEEPEMSSSMMVGSRIRWP